MLSRGVRIVFLAAYSLTPDWLRYRLHLPAMICTEEPISITARRTSTSGVCQTPAHAPCLEVHLTPKKSIVAAIVPHSQKPAADVEPGAPIAMNTSFGFSEPLVADTPLPFPEQCARIHDRIAAFLDKEDVSDRVKSVQEQTRIALGVIDQALEQYRWVVTVPQVLVVVQGLTYSVCQRYLWHTMEGKTASFS